MGKKYLKKEEKVSNKKKKKKRSSSISSINCDSSVSSSSSSSISSIDEETKRKLKKKIKRLRKKEKIKKKEKRKKALKKLLKEKIFGETKKNETPSTSCDVDVNLMKKSKSLAPMTKEEWEKQQNIFKRVFDEETGRMRLVKGTGEIIEECISRERHLAINKQATKGDGEFFQKKLAQHMK